MTDTLFPKLPLGRWIEGVVDDLEVYFSGLFDVIADVVSGVVDLFMGLFQTSPFWLVIGMIVLLAWWISGWRLSLFSLLGLLFIHNLGLWHQAMQTLSLVLTSSLISVVAGVPLGIWCARRDWLQRLVMPVLDLMQTMPVFVYLIPAIFFFGLGKVPGVIASVVFAMPPVIRLTNLGIRQVPLDLIEVANAFGSTMMQKLWKVELPLARQTIIAGVNQSIMLSLSMVVVASMVGAKGLGSEVYRAVTRMQIGNGFEAGFSIVILAILLDRFTGHVGKKGGVRAG